MARWAAVIAWPLLAALSPAQAELLEVHVTPPAEPLDYGEREWGEVRVDVAIHCDGRLAWDFPDRTLFLLATLHGVWSPYADAVPVDASPCIASPQATLTVNLTRQVQSDRSGPGLEPLAFHVYVSLHAEDVTGQSNFLGEEWTGSSYYVEPKFWFSAESWGLLRVHGREATFAVDIRSYGNLEATFEPRVVEGGEWVSVDALTLPTRYAPNVRSGIARVHFTAPPEPWDEVTALVEFQAVALADPAWPTGEPQRILLTFVNASESGNAAPSAPPGLTLAALALALLAARRRP